MATAHETLQEVTAAGRKLRDAIPDAYSGYARMSAAAMADGRLAVHVPLPTRGRPASRASSWWMRSRGIPDLRSTRIVSRTMSAGPAT